MKLQPRKLLLSCAGCAFAAAAMLTLPACTDTGYYDNSATSYGSAHYRVGSGNYHCHPGGICHDVQHENYDWRGGFRRPIRYHQRSTYRPAPPPPRPRPL
ncbi:hypothetical protein SAMN04487965_1649 [Microbulbifer donghaiensis]|uniref:YHYH protein n=1 Tax=Microbulbifer donghaiensis TaxID=494016 RepID=A0A1M4ZTS2_9GAMM|nr:hypothetical protein [Microbulbifer donghaiensis]SHF21480.1 hypothetical protein SAMN04487965_1649 [Microbulbifer donghaiensis]